MLVADQMQQCVHERRLPGLADDLWAENGVSELAGQTARQLLSAVDWKCEHVGRLVLAQMVPLQAAHLVGRDEDEAEIAVVDPLRGEHLARELRGSLLIDLCPAAVCDFDGHRHQTSLATLCAGLLRMPAVGLHDPLDELVPDDVFMAEADERDAVERAEDILHLDQA